MVFRGSAATMANLAAIQWFWHHEATQVMISTWKNNWVKWGSHWGTVGLVLEICWRLEEVHNQSRQLLELHRNEDTERWAKKRWEGMRHEDIPPYDFGDFIERYLRGKNPLIFERRETYKTSLIVLMRTLRALWLKAKIALNPVNWVYWLEVSGDIDIVRTILNK